MIAAIVTDTASYIVISDTMPLPRVFITIKPWTIAPTNWATENKNSAVFTRNTREPTAILAELAASLPPHRPGHYGCQRQAYYKQRYH